MLSSQFTSSPTWRRLAKNVGLNASVEAREETFAIIHLIFVALGEDSLRVWDIREAGELESIIIRLSQAP